MNICDSELVLHQDNENKDKEIGELGVASCKLPYEGSTHIHPARI